jgi:hypothetical protein
LKLSFKVSKLTIIFSLYVIISASYMYQVMNFIRFDLWFQKKIISENFEKAILEKLEYYKEITKDSKEKEEDPVKKEEKEKKEKEERKTLINKAYIKNSKDGYYYLNKNLTEEEKIDLRNILLNLGKRDNLDIFIWIVFFIFGILLLIYLIKLKLNFFRLIIAIIVFGLGILYAFTISKYISERIHLIYFGTIGFLFTKDNLEESNIITIIYTIIWSMLIATFDEIFQLFLPYRVGDVRDIILGTLGGLWGGLAYLVLKIKNINIKKNNKDSG